MIRDDLAALVDRSLLTRSGDVAGSARFAMLESLRHYGTIELRSGQLVASTRDAHLAHFAEFASRADAGMRGHDQVSWLHRIDVAYTNIRNAIGWSLDGGSLETGIGLAARTGRYWDWRGLLKEGSAWTERLTAAASAPVPGLPEIHAWRSFIAWEYGAAESHTHRSRVLFEKFGDRRGESWGLISLAQICLGHGDTEAAELNARSALEAATATEDDRSTLWALEILADTAQRRGEQRRSALLWGVAHPLRESRRLAGSVSKLSTPTDLGTLLAHELGELFEKLVESGRRNPDAAIAEELRGLGAGPGQNLTAEDSAAMARAVGRHYELTDEIVAAWESSTDGPGFR